MNKQTFNNHITALRKARDKVTAAQCLLLIDAVKTIERKAAYIREAAARGIVINTVYDYLDRISSEADETTGKLQELEDLR